MSDTQVVGPVLAVPESETERADGGPFGIKGLAWAIFEGARNPYYNLIADQWSDALKNAFHSLPDYTG